MNYATVLKSDIENLNEEDRDWLFGQLVESSLTTCRESSDGYVVVKWDVESCPLTALNIEHDDFNYLGILTELKKENWNIDPT